MLPNIGNPVFIGGMGLMAVGGVLASLRSLPGKLWNLLSRHLWVECFVDGYDSSFYWVNQWLADRPEVKSSNILRVESRWFDDSHGSRNERRTTLVPGVGEHIIKFEGARFWFSVSKEDKKPGAKDGGLRDPFKPYNINIRTWKTKRATLTKLLAEVDLLSRELDPTKTRVYLPDYDHWNLRSVQHVRKASSVILEDGLFSRLVGRLQQFTDAEQWYEDLGIPYRYGTLLHGPPGNGKSSLVLTLAGVLKRDLYVLPLGDVNLDDHKLLVLMAEVPPKSIVLVEDVDTVFNGRDRKAENKLTFSGVLNAIDGALASEGRVLFVTANHPGTLDHALIRPGRCDEHVELKNASVSQASQLYDRFFPNSPTTYSLAFATWAGDGTHCMAQLQGHLLTYQGDPARAADQGCLRVEATGSKP